MKKKRTTESLLDTLFIGQRWHKKWENCVFENYVHLRSSQSINISDEPEFYVRSIFFTHMFRATYLSEYGNRRFTAFIVLKMPLLEYSAVFFAALLFCCRSFPSLEPLVQVSGWGLRWNGSHHRIQQGASEQSEQPAPAAGWAGDRRSSAEYTIERKKEKFQKPHRKVTFILSLCY